MDSLHELVATWLTTMESEAIRLYLTAKQMSAVDDSPYSKGQYEYAKGLLSGIRRLRGRIPEAWKSPFTRHMFVAPFALAAATEPAKQGCLDRGEPQLGDEPDGYTPEKERLAAFLSLNTIDGFACVPVGGRIIRKPEGSHDE